MMRFARRGWKTLRALLEITSTGLKKEELLNKARVSVKGK
jgi:hypothetical protein